MEQPRIVRSLMEEKVRQMPRLPKTDISHYETMSPSERLQEKNLVRIHLERVGRMIQNHEDHLKDLRVYQDDLITRKHELEKLSVPILVVTTKTPRPTISQSDLDLLSSLTEEEIELIKESLNV